MRNVASPVAPGGVGPAGGGGRVEPDEIRNDRGWDVGGEVEDFETDAFDQSGVNVNAALEEQLTPRLRASVGLEAGFASILDAQAKAQGAGRRDVYVLSGTGTAEYVGVRDILDPINGVRARVADFDGVQWVSFRLEPPASSQRGGLLGFATIGALRSQRPDWSREEDSPIPSRSTAT